MCKISDSFKKAMKSAGSKIIQITTKDYRTATIALSWIEQVIVPNVSGLDLLTLKNSIHKLSNCVDRKYDAEVNNG